MHAAVRTVSHFERLHDQMLCADALSPQPGVDGDLTGILDLYFHEDHPEKILFAGPAMSHWITEDFGRTYHKVRLLTVPKQPSSSVGARHASATIHQG